MLHAKFTVMARNYKLIKLSSCIGRFTDIPTDQCVIKCVLYSTCISFNFHDGDKICELISVSKFDEVGLIVPQEGWTHYETDITEKKVSEEISSFFPHRSF